MTGYESKRAAAQDKLDSMEREALKLALEALEASAPWVELTNEAITNDRAIAYIKEALAQPAQPIQQEPVAWADIQKEAQQIVESKFLWKKFIDGTPLSNDIACWMADFAQQYTAPPQRPWVDLTESEWFNWWRVSQVADETEAEIDFADFLIIAQAVTAKLKEKNSA